MSLTSLESRILKDLIESEKKGSISKVLNEINFGDKGNLVVAAAKKLNITISLNVGLTEERKIRIAINGKIPISDKLLAELQNNYAFTEYETQHVIKKYEKKSGDQVQNQQGQQKEVKKEDEKPAKLEVSDSETEFMKQFREVSQKMVDQLKTSQETNGALIKEIEKLTKLADKPPKSEPKKKAEVKLV